MTKRTDHYNRALEDATYITDKLAEAEKRMMDARPGLPGAQAFDSPSVSGGTSSSPTERTALATVEHGNRATADIRAMDRALRDFGTASEVLRRLVDAYTPHAATAKDQASVDKANDPEAVVPGCVHHHDFNREWVPAHRTSTVGGNLPHPMALCRWCYDRVRTDGRLPTADRMERLARSKPDRVRA